MTLLIKDLLSLAKGLEVLLFDDSSVALLGSMSASNIRLTWYKTVHEGYKVSEAWNKLKKKMGC